MSRIFTLLSICMILSAPLYADGDLKFKHAAPEGLKTLSSEMQHQKKAPINSGHHGMKEYCYHSDVYFVYRKNLLGDGYILSREKPKDLICVNTSDKDIRNSLGMYIGQPKNEINELLNIKSMSDQQIIWWHSKTEIRGIMFDVQTYAEFRFEDDKLGYLNVFTTITN